MFGVKQILDKISLTLDLSLEDRSSERSRTIINSKLLPTGRRTISSKTGQETTPPKKKCYL